MSRRYPTVSYEATCDDQEILHHVRRIKEIVHDGGFPVKTKFSGAKGNPGLDNYDVIRISLTGVPRGDCGKPGANSPCGRFRLPRTPLHAEVATEKGGKTTNISARSWAKPPLAKYCGGGCKQATPKHTTPRNWRSSQPWEVPNFFHTKWDEDLRRGGRAKPATPGAHWAPKRNRPANKPGRANDKPYHRAASPAKPARSIFISHSDWDQSESDWDEDLRRHQASRATAIEDNKSAPEVIDLTGDEPNHQSEVLQQQKRPDTPRPEPEPEPESAKLPDLGDLTIYSDISDDELDEEVAVTRRAREDAVNMGVRTSSPVSIPFLEGIGDLIPTAGDVTRELYRTSSWEVIDNPLSDQLIGGPQRL